MEPRLHDQIKFRRRKELPFHRYGLMVRCRKEASAFELWRQQFLKEHLFMREAAVLMSAASQDPFGWHPPSEFSQFLTTLKIPSAVLGTVHLLLNGSPTEGHPDLAYVASKDGVAREICHLDYEGIWYATEAMDGFRVRFLKSKFWTDPDLASTDAVTGVKALLYELTEHRVTLGTRCPPNPWSPAL
jgi:hypothetical protein